MHAVVIHQPSLAVFKGNLPSLPGIVEPDASWLEGIGIESSSDPFEVGIVCLVVWIADGSEEFAIAESAPAQFPIPIGKAFIPV